MTHMRRKYTKEEKLQIVKESMEDDVTLVQLAERYNIHTNTIGRWRQELNVFGDVAFPGKGKERLTDQERELVALRKELREAQLANEILKKAMGIIVSPNRKNLLS